MASILLHCSICPKTPNFSDTSHLLTHVSSKGHLAHLHKLQVRSHQEIGASHQLAVYDQWYQLHGVAQLLSERMLQKEAKKATKRVRSAAPQKRVKREASPSTNPGTNPGASHHLQTNPLPIAHQQFLYPQPTNHPHGFDTFTMAFDGESEYDSSPVKAYRKRNGRRNIPSPVKGFPFDDEPKYPDPDCIAEDDPEVILTPDTSKLKGVLWPGMDLFDAATAEMRRRRNQKKDGKILRQMEINSMIVEPAEVIFSPGGTMRKIRQISGMVEDSSPLKGETPIPRKPIRRKRPALAEANGNIPRYRTRLFQPDQPRMTSNISDLEKLSRKVLPYLLSSSTGESFDQTSLFSPTEDENLEFQLTVGNLNNREKGTNWNVFNDSESVFQPQKPPSAGGQMEAAYPRVVPSQTQFNGIQTGQHNPFLPNSWIQSIQYGQPHLALYKAYAETQPSFSSQQGLGVGKENIQPSISRRTQAEEQPNPLGWAYNNVEDEESYPLHHMARSDAQMKLSGLAPQDDPFGYFVNPLNAAFQHLQSKQESALANGGAVIVPHSSFDEKKGIISPDGTVSDHDGDDYVQNILETTA